LIFKDYVRLIIKVLYEAISSKTPKLKRNDDENGKKKEVTVCYD